MDLLPYSQPITLHPYYCSSTVTCLCDYTQERMSSFFKNYSLFTMLCQSISAVQQSDPVVCACTHTHTHTHSFSHIIFHLVLYQEIRYSSLCYTVWPHCLSFLNVIVCIYWPQTPSPSHSLPHLPWQPQVCSLCLWVCFCFIYRFICTIF